MSSGGWEFGYKVVEVELRDIAQLERQAVELMQAGWKPLGGVAASTGAEGGAYYAQAFTREIPQ